MKKYLISLLGCSLLLFWTEQLAAQYTLEVVVEGIRVEKKGVISLGIFQKGSDFPAVGAELKGVRLKVEGEEMRYAFTNLPKGDYAISLFHDENDNLKLDTNLLGLPKEGYGFSKNFRPRMGPPNFEDVAIDVSSGDQKVYISVRY